MFDRIFSHFDTSFDFDFFDKSVKSKRVQQTTPQIIMDQAAELWSMWVKERITFQYENGSNISLSTNHRLEDMMESNGLLTSQRCEAYIQCSRNPHHLNAKHLIVDPLQWDHRVLIPNHFATKSEDYAIATDCVAAAGIEALELHTTVFNKLTFICLKDLWANMHHLGGVFSGLNTEKQDLNSRMFAKVWGAIELQVIRANVLKAWPGWREMFENKDAAVTDSKLSVQKFVNGKEHSSSEFERFCTAMAYNINMLQDKVRLPNEPNFKQASDYVKSVWLNILQTQDPSSRVIQMSDMFAELRRILSMDKDASKKDRKHNLDSCDEPLVNPQYRKRPEERIIADKHVSPQSQAGMTDGKVIVRADLKNSSEVTDANPSRLIHLKNMYYKNTYQKSEDLRREAATAAWHVALPPATEHGQLSGSLDEGALHKFAAWGDSNIFDQPPEAGAGEVALAILIDCSGSMTGDKLAGAKQFADAIWHGIGNRPNVKLTQFAFMNEGNCNMLRIDNADHIDKLIATGGTPIAVSVNEACIYLCSHYPTAAKGIIILTDGDACAHSRCVSDTDGSKPHTNDHPPFTAQVIRSLPIPVVGVGFGGVNRNEMFRQFGTNKYFMVDQPQDAVKVVAEVLRSATI